MKILKVNVKTKIAYGAIKRKAKTFFWHQIKNDTLIFRE